MRKKKILFFILIFVLSLFAQFSYGVTLFFDPKEGSYSQGDVFLVNLTIDTQGKRINAIEGEIFFSQNFLEVVDLSEANSIFSFWPQKPAFSNEEGKIWFVGGVPLGFEGEGKILTIALRARQKEEKEGMGEIEISDKTKVFLNDGKGSLIEFEKKKAIISLSKKEGTVENQWLNLIKEDTIPPEPFEVILGKDPFVFEGKYFIFFHTTDLQTGIDYYEVKEGKKPWKRGESPYLLEDQELKDRILVKAVDKAGNERVAEFLPPKREKRSLLIISFFYGLVFFVLLYLIFKLLRKRTLK